MPQNVETLISRPNPYVGPRPYRRGETIYGREKESAELADLLIAERIILLYSPSGAGKSSMLNASVIPSLEKNGFEVLPVMRVNMEPPIAFEHEKNFNRYVYSALVAIEDSLPEEQRFSQQELALMSFKEYFKKYRERVRDLNPDDDAQHSLAIIIDQGEEIITIDPANRESKQTFFNQLGEALRDRTLWCMFSLREDYLPRLDSYIRPIPTGFSARYRLRLLGFDSALSAIKKPAEQQGVLFSEEAARQLADDLRMMQVQLADGSVILEPGLYVEPVQLQVVCRRLWTELPREKNEITVENIKEIGDVDTALADYYALQVASVANKTNTRERTIREWIDRKLISQQGVRLQVLKSQDASDGLPNNVIEQLERTYLVRAEKRGSTWFELAHDRLVDPVRKNNTEWFENHLNLFQRAADVWAQQGRSDGLLLFGPDYLQADKWARDNADILTNVEIEFLAACQKFHLQTEREKRNNRIVQILLGVSLIALFAAVILYFQAESARRQADIAKNLARTSELAAASLSELETDPGLSILLALEAMRNTNPPTSGAINAMHRALPASRLEQTFIGHTDRVYAISYSPDGRWLASASLDGTVKIWDMQSLETPLAHDIRISPQDSAYGATTVTFSPDGRFLAAANAEGEIILWDAVTWQEIKRIEAHPQAIIWKLAFSPASDLIASAGEDAILKTWNTDLSLAAEFPAIHREGIEALAFSPDGSQIATASLDGSAILWDTASAQNLFTFRIKANIITNPTQLLGVTFSLDGSRLITSASDSNIYVWDAVNGTQESLMKISGHEDWVYGLLVRPGSDIDAVEGEIISAGADRSINIWDVRYGRLRLELRGHTDQVYAIALNPQDDGMLASASADNTVRIWNIAWDGNYERFNADLESPVYDQPGEWLPSYSEDIDFSPDGKVLAVSMAIAANPIALYPTYGKPGSVVFLDPATGKPIGKPLMGHTASVMAVSFNSQGDRLVSASWDKTAIIWDLSQPEHTPLFTLQHDSQVYSASYSKDDRWIVTGQNNGTVIIWDAASGQMRNSFQPNSERLAIQQVSFNADASLVAVQSRNSSNLLLVDALSGEVRMTLHGHDDIIRDFDFNPDGTRLVTVSDDAEIFIWDLSPGLSGDQRLLPFDFSDHLATIYSVNFSGDGEKILSAGADGIIKVWQVNDPGTEEETWQLAYSLYSYAFGSDDTILDIEIDPTRNEHVVALANDWTVRGFTFNTDELIALAEQKIENRKVNCREIEKYQLTNQYDCIP